MVSTVAGFVETRCQEEMGKNTKTSPAVFVAAAGAPEGYKQLLSLWRSLRFRISTAFEESQLFTARPNKMFLF